MKNKKRIAQFLTMALVANLFVPNSVVLANNEVYKGEETIELSEEDLLDQNIVLERIAQIREDKLQNPEKFRQNYSILEESKNELEALAGKDVYEVERNDTFELADIIERGDYVHGCISDADDVDFYKVKFNDYGVARIWLKDIPRKCDYDVIVYNSDKKEINAGLNSSNSDEEVYIHVEPDKWYYISVCGITGYSDSDEYYLRVFITDYVATAYGTVQNSLNTVQDIENAKVYLGQAMGYEVEPYDKPTASDLESMEGAAVILISTHGTEDEVTFANDETRDPKYKCGVYSGDSGDRNGYSYVGLRDLNLDAAKLIIFASCLSAGESQEFSRNIANRAVTVSKAKASIGWVPKLHSPSATFWLNWFYSNLGSESSTIESAAKDVNLRFPTQWDESVYEWKIYGDADENICLPTVTQPYNIIEDESFNEASKVVDIEEKIDIDIKNKNFDNLESYLENNISGFSTDKFSLNMDRIHDTGEGDYFLYYNYIENGFMTPYCVVVSCKNEEPQLYSYNFTEDIVTKATQSINSDVEIIDEGIFDQARILALQSIDDKTFVVENQEVIPKVDKEGNCYLYVRTIGNYSIDGKEFSTVYTFDFIL